MNLPFLKTDVSGLTMPSGSQRRGSTILLVLAMLSILLLLGIAFSYSTRLESQASFNYAKLAQARTSAATGLPMSLPMLLQASQGITTPLQNWNTVPQALQKMGNGTGKQTELTSGDMAVFNQAGLRVRQGKSGELESAPQANVQLRDLSGLVNLNALKDQAAMERVVSAVLPGGDAQRKSAALLTLRGDNPMVNASARGVAADHDESASIDPRDQNAQMLDNLTRLRIDVQSDQPLFTDIEIQKLAKFVTVFSQAPEVYNGADNIHVPKIPLDYVDAKHVYTTLRAAFPGKNNDLLLQFAANVADFSDADSEPTLLDANGDTVIAATGDGPGKADITIGVEMTPFISEVYPDSETSISFDDDGQYVEIVNPWNTTISLAGWTLRTGSGASIQLTGQLAPGGFLVITDNYDQPKPDSPPGHGSLVSLFGITADGGARQVITDPTFDLADRNSRVTLYGSEAQLVDVFTYESTGQVDGKVSFQRADPMVRGASQAQATPLASFVGSVGNSEAGAAATKVWEDGNTTMTKVSQLFALSSGFVEHTRDAAVAGTGKVHPSQMPELKMPETFNAAAPSAADPYPDNLDLRLIDIFTATPFFTANVGQGGMTSGSLGFNRSNENSTGAADKSSSAYQAFRNKMDKLRERNARSTTQEAEAETTVPTVFSYGKLNINTCAKYALLGLSLDAPQGAAAPQGGFAAMVEQFEGHRLRNGQQGIASFMNVSDFVSRFAPNISRGNLTQLDTITNQVTVGSSSFEVIATNRLSSKDQKALESKERTNGPRPATATARWIISMDQQPYSVVGFTLIP